jgi:hypothetical protein
MWGSLLVDALVVGLVVWFIAWLSVWLVHPQLIMLEFVAALAVAWKKCTAIFLAVSTFECSPTGWR